MEYKDYSVYVSSREPETLMKSIDMTSSPKGTRKSSSSPSRASTSRRPLQSSDSITLRALSKSDQQVLLRASRKGTHLNDPQAFNRRVIVTRQTIDNVPILPKLGCSDPTFVGRMQDQNTGGLYRMGNRTLTDALVYNSHQESSDPFVRKNGDRVRRQSADRGCNKPLVQEDAKRKSKELEGPPFVEPYKYTVFNIETKSSRINFRHDTKKKVAKKDLTDSDSWESFGEFTGKSNSSKSKAETIVSQPSLYEKSSVAFKDYVDPCLHHAEDSLDSVQQFSPMLSQMDDTSSNDSATSENGSVASNLDSLPLVKNTDPHIYNVVEADDKVPFPVPPAAAHGQVEDGTMTSFINWTPRPMYLAAQPMYVQPVFYPIDEKRFGTQQYPLAPMIEASLKEFANTSRPTTPMYYAPSPAEMLLLTSDGKTNSRTSTPVYYPADLKANSRTSTPAYYTPVHQPDNIQVLDEVRNINDTSEEDLTSLNKQKSRRKGLFKRLFGFGKKNDKKPVAEIPRRDSTTLTVSPKGSRDRSELRKAKQTSSLLLMKKRQPKNAPKGKGSGCTKKNSEEFDGEPELLAKESSPSVIVINVPKAKPNTKTALPKKKRSALKLRRPKTGPYKKQPIRRPTRVQQRAEPQESEVELASPSHAVYVLHEPEHKGLSPVASEQQMKSRRSPTGKPKKQKSSLKMCAGKQRTDDTTQTAGDPPYGTREQQGYSHVQIG